MMIDDYSEYSGIGLDEIVNNINNYSENISKDIIKFRSIVGDSLLYNSKNLIYDSIKLEFNIDKDKMVEKYKLFSPHMLSMIVNSNYKSLLDYMGLGTLSELIKDIDESIKVTYTNVDSDIYNFIKWRFKKYNLDISVKELSIDYLIQDSYDVIVSDGNLHLFSGKKQIEIVDSMVEKLNNNGLFCLLVDISPANSNVLSYGVDIINIHSVLEQSDMICIYGRNTFSSIWKKII